MRRGANKAPLLRYWSDMRVLSGKRLGAFRKRLKATKKAVNDGD